MNINDSIGGRPNVARVSAAASTNATSVKAAPGVLYGFVLRNTAAAAKFVKFYDKASAPTVGTDTPKFVVPLAANGFAEVFPEHGVPFALGIAYAITGAVGDSDTTAVTANDVHGFLSWL